MPPGPDGATSLLQNIKTQALLETFPLGSVSGTHRPRSRGQARCFETVVKFTVGNSKCMLTSRKADTPERVLGALIKHFKETEYRIHAFCAKNIKVFKCVILIPVAAWEQENPISFI